MNNAWVKPIITRRVVENFKKSVKIGDKAIYKSIYKDVEKRTVKPIKEKVVVVEKYPHIVLVVNPEKPKRIKSMTYIELLLQKMGEAVRKEA